MLRFHTQTAGVQLTAQQPEVNLVRVAVQGLAAVLGGTQSLHTNSFDEAIALPTEKAARLALRTQQVLAYETDITRSVDPFAGSYAIESLTDDLEDAANDLMSQVEDLGGAVHAIERGFQKNEIERSAYAIAREIDAGERTVVGVNRFITEEDEPYEPLRVDPAIEEGQVRRLESLRAARSANDVKRTLDALRAAASGSDNVLYPMKEALAAGQRSARCATHYARSGGRTSRQPRSDGGALMRIAVVGSYGIGMTMRVPRLPVAGETLLGGEFVSGHGGKGSNQAVAARRLGADVAFLTAVGDDVMGHAARELWRSEGVDASATVTAPASTMVGLILVEPSGENRIAIATGALEHLRPKHVEAFSRSWPKPRSSSSRSRSSRYGHRCTAPGPRGRYGHPAQSGACTTPSGPVLEGRRCAYAQPHRGRDPARTRPRRSGRC